MDRWAFFLQHPKGSEMKDAIVEAIKAEIESEFHRPTLIMGDFNAVPGSLRSVKGMLDTNQWIDVGACASWWGGEDGTPTCQTRPQAKPTRIDGVLANNMAIPLIRGFQVEKDEEIPTHAVLQLKLERETEQRGKDVREETSIVEDPIRP